MGAQRLLLTRIPSPGSGLGCWRSLGSGEGLERTVGCRGSSSAMGCQRRLCSASTATISPGTRALTKPLACEPDCVRLVKVNDVAQNTLPGEGCRDLPGLVRQFRRVAGGSRGRERRMPSAEVGLQFKRVRRPTRRKRGCSPSPKSARSRGCGGVRGWAGCQRGTAPASPAPPWLRLS